MVEPNNRSDNKRPERPCQLAVLSERRVLRAVKRNSACAAIGGAAVKTAGGTTELHSRSGRAVFIRPCQLAELSGRSAAQDGQLAALGGPERAEVKCSRGTLSAGRAAAPGSRVGAEWRGRSDDRVAYVLAERAKPGGQGGHGEAARASARARPFQAMARAVFSAVAAVGLFVGLAIAADDVVAKPGASGTIEYEFKNTGTGPNERIEDLTIVPVVPPEGAGVVTFGAVTIKEDANLVPPITIEPGVTRTFVFAYQISGTANDASFPVNLHVQMLNQFTDPDPSTLDTSVRFTVDRMVPIIKVHADIACGIGGSESSEFVTPLEEILGFCIFGGESFAWCGAFSRRRLLLGVRMSFLRSSSAARGCWFWTAGPL